jgi:hypothetical protein
VSTIAHVLANPYAPPSPVFVPAATEVATVSGDTLRLPSGHPLPPLCAKCGRPDSLVPREHTFARRSPWVYLGLVLGLLPGLLLIWDQTKRATVILPLCVDCDARWTSTILAQRLAAWSPVGACVVLMLAGAMTDSLALYGLAAFVAAPAIVVAPVLVRLLLTRRRMLRVSAIDDHALVLRGFSPVFLRAIAGAPR